MIKISCISCAQPRVEGYVKCQACLDNQRRRREESRKQRISSGLCVLCGKNPPKGVGIARCVGCLGNAALERQRRKDNGLCRCGKVSERGVGKICATCLAAAKRRQKKLNLSGACTRCCNPVAARKFLCDKCATNSNEKRRSDAKLRKREVFIGYGGKCQCSPCGEINFDFLTVDHKNNDGNTHRRTVKFGASLYTWILKNKFPDILQLLCWNCNMAKRFNGGVCPHVSS